MLNDNRWSTNRAWVREGYDRAGDAYTRQRDQFTSIPHLERLTARLKPGATILDVGCGAGVPIDRYLVDRGYRVLGIDLSERQIERARANVPEAAYTVLDMTTLMPHDYSVDAIISFYAIFHTPRDGHAALLRTFHSFLPPGGLLLVTMGSSEWEGIEPFHNVPMYWSHYGSTRNRSLIEEAGFNILHDVIDEQQGERHHVVFAQRSAAPPASLGGSG